MRYATQSELADIMEVSPTAISTWKQEADFPKPSGRRRNGGRVSVVYSVNEVLDWYQRRNVDKLEHHYMIARMEVSKWRDRMAAAEERAAEAKRKWTAMQKEVDEMRVYAAQLPAEGELKSVA